MLVKPNPIDFDKVWIAFSDLHNNMAVLATMISIILFYLLVIVWSRRADIRDRDSQVIMTNSGFGFLLPNITAMKLKTVSSVGGVVCKHLKLTDVIVVPFRGFHSWLSIA